MIGLYLPELRVNDAMTELAIRYEQRYRHPPINISHWNAGATFLSNLVEFIPTSFRQDPFEYTYSCTLRNRTTVADKLGLSSDHRELFVVENGTSAINMTINYLSLIGVRRVFVLCPTYFSCLYGLGRAGMEVSKAYMQREGNGYHLPSVLPSGASTAIWVTNPIFNTGVRLSIDDVDRLVKIMDAGVTVVGDLSLAVTPNALGTDIENHKNFIGIYCPHKSLLINSMKFSAISVPTEIVESFNDWGDVLVGSLSLSCAGAIDHYLSDNFADCMKIVRDLLSSARAYIENISRTLPKVDLDRLTVGHFMTVYCPQLPALLQDDECFIENAVMKSGAIFLSGSRSSTDPALGFSFRVNLARDSPQFRGALMRLCEHLSGTIV